MKEQSNWERNLQNQIEYIRRGKFPKFLMEEGPSISTNEILAQMALGTCSSHTFSIYLLSQYIRTGHYEAEPAIWDFAIDHAIWPFHLQGNLHLSERGTIEFSEVCSEHHYYPRKYRYADE